MIAEVPHCVLDAEVPAPAHADPGEETTQLGDFNPQAKPIDLTVAI